MTEPNLLLPYWGNENFGSTPALFRLGFDGQLIGASLEVRRAERANHFCNDLFRKYELSPLLINTIMMNASYVLGTKDPVENPMTQSPLRRNAALALVLNHCTQSRSFHAHSAATAARITDARLPLAILTPEQLDLPPASMPWSLMDSAIVGLPGYLYQVIPGATSDGLHTSVQKFAREITRTGADRQEVTARAIQELQPAATSFLMANILMSLYSDAGAALAGR